MIFNIIYICVTRLLETKMHPISQIIGGNLRIFSKKSLRFSQLLAVWRSCLASPAWPPLTFDDGKGRRSPCISSKRASFSCNCLTNCCMKLIEIMRVWYNIYMYMYMYEVCIFMYVEIVLHTNRLYDICHAKFHMFYSRYATILYTYPFTALKNSQESHVMVFHSHDDHNFSSTAAVTFEEWCLAKEDVLIKN